MSLIGITGARSFFFAALLLLVVGVVCGLSGIDVVEEKALNPDIFRVYPGEHMLGDSTAPVTVIAYMNFSCAYCAVFNADILPRLREEFVDAGTVRVIYRVFPGSQDITGYSILSAELAECSSVHGAFWNMASVIFDQAGENVWKNYRQWSARAGLDANALDECMSFHKSREYVLGTQARFGSHEIVSTPTVIVGNRKIEGLHRYDTYADAIRNQRR